MITLTESAASEVKRLMEANGLGEAFLRIGVQGGGCSGYSYALDFDGKAEESDMRFEQHGVRLVCDMKSYLLLNGITIDYERKLIGGGFTFSNPNATGSCGCGTSFSA